MYIQLRLSRMQILDDPADSTASSTVLGSTIH